MMKSVKIPYKRRKNFVLFKEIKYDIRKKYKKVIYGYDEYSIKTKEIINTYNHRINKPAIIIYSKNKIIEVQYWKFGKLHRAYGPAIIRYSKNGIVDEIWFIKGNELSDDDVKQRKKLINRRKKSLKLILKIKNKFNN
jgi:hypothetical protein